MKWLVVLFAVSLFVVTSAASACEVRIVGMGMGQPPYPSITSALAALPDRDGNHLVVSGVCREKVEVLNHVSLTIEGDASTGARLEPPLGNTQRHPQTLTIRTSDVVTVRDMTISGTPNVTGALSLWHSRNVSIRNAVITGGGGSEGGVWSIDSEGVTLENATIEGNGNGIRIDGGRVSLVGKWQAGMTGTSYLRNNNTGATINQGGTLSLRGDTIVTENNVGVSARGGMFSVCCFEDIAHPRIEDNRAYGVLMRGGDVQVQSPLVVQRNALWGLIFIGTQARVWDAVVRANGSTAAHGGILMMSGTLDLQGTEVSGSPGRGVVLADGATGRMQLVNITGNAAEGVDVQALSVAGVFSGTVRGNGAFDLRCTPNSFGYGTAAVVGTMKCSGFNQSPDPTPGRNDF